MWAGHCLLSTGQSGWQRRPGRILSREAEAVPLLWCPARPDAAQRLDKNPARHIRAQPLFKHAKHLAQPAASATVVLAQHGVCPPLSPQASLQSQRGLALGAPFFNRTHHGTQSLIRQYATGGVSKHIVVVVFFAHCLCPSQRRPRPCSENGGEASATYLSVMNSSTGKSSASHANRSSAMATGIICSSMVPNSLTSAAFKTGLAPWVQFFAPTPRGAQRCPLAAGPMRYGRGACACSQAFGRTARCWK